MGATSASTIGSTHESVGGHAATAESTNATALLDAPSGEETSGDPTETENQKPLLRWLDPAIDEFQIEGEHLTLRREEDTSARRVFLVRTFPATSPDAYISVRAWNEGGDDEELGMIRFVTEWPARIQEPLRDTLNRQYLLRTIRKINSLTLNFGFLEFDVETDTGQIEFTCRWTQGKAIAFGDHGKLLIATDDNRYVVPNINELSDRDREVFLQYVYW